MQWQLCFIQITRWMMCKRDSNNGCNSLGTKLAQRRITIHPELCLRSKSTPNWQTLNTKTRRCTSSSSQSATTYKILKLRLRIRMMESLCNRMEEIWSTLKERATFSTISITNRVKMWVQTMWCTQRGPTPKKNRTRRIRVKTSSKTRT